MIACDNVYTWKRMYFSGLKRPKSPRYENPSNAELNRSTVNVDTIQQKNVYKKGEALS